ncbi:MAG: diaminopimelate decarboxylase [Deltaproteobacteria bacterium RIFCSPLOWO2_12_FULL_44_12]|nr:MAG: diaminopimelate decarboxylase [Deltaproteobacteria bacterium RIFCSPHIGHO2_01_FULL_43_49]OGQ16342.1 MAG: diaminopimelate decarboxylase [Deltaproteobacteria bacterium RIFCSPHIGHO2_02_FULL_44_53]OGQ29303.1 MAG: diaminopimelate decarboxylase [Deltaproteobacteria bacterium RIFCSPHIGHO2_12_FULL_44_21]OGQ32860.1 MAG: diaminopimelate decarboxylase [Deltaproteobacteria bacterium RIFCSPLOWO2_01_FULL_45_74]OGQ41961.1 MAG: diaminopimelate decarboxylase [Deltaproteobacteria bacterium RIFCSPLOWO2_02_
MKIKDSKIYFEDVAAEELAKTYGTPLYVYEANRIRDNYRRLQKAFQTRWPQFKIYYAVKSNTNPAIIRLLMEEGAGCDCASANEIRLATKLGAKGEEILFSGNNLNEEDFAEGAKAKALFNLDDLSLLDRLLKHGKPEVLSFRVNPAIGKSNVHDSDVMAGKQAKFGIPWEKAEEAYAKAVDAGIKRFGVHMMTGSCVTEPDYFAEITTKLLDCVGPIAKSLNIKFEFIDIGGGFGIPYTPDEKPLDIEKTATLVTKVFKEKVAQYQLGEPQLVVEPGRYLVGDAGFVIGRVHAIKESYKKFVGTDIGMNILARPVLYGAYHGIFVDKKSEARNPKSEIVTITGQACENADAWAKDRELPKIEVGDLIVVENAGAYGYVMSYPYNGRLRAAEVLVDQGKHKLIRRRETFEDWLGLTI